MISGFAPPPFTDWSVTYRVFVVEASLIATCLYESSLLIISPTVSSSSNDILPNLCDRGGRGLYRGLFSSVKGLNKVYTLLCQLLISARVANFFHKKKSRKKEYIKYKKLIYRNGNSSFDNKTQNLDYFRRK